MTDTQTQPLASATAGTFYFLFAHTPYPGNPPAPDINATVVVAETLLHPAAHQPAGRLLHHQLTTGKARRAGEVVPLSTLIHELALGQDSPCPYDWDALVDDLLALSLGDGCDALTLSLGTVDLALVCCGPAVRLVALGPVGQAHQDISGRDAVLDVIAHHIDQAVTQQPFWPGEIPLSALPE
ncbi:hypothetical protein [Streptomyces sp. WM6378]|uniref:hypothetical protein n=1 Tax=Streptomyces sp. WM6378 TaxID=1415557 RepID=UPI0006AE58E6|nr:hypothetical protein [Streptomyces sp. WM6378]